MAKVKGSNVGEELDVGLIESGPFKDHMNLVEKISFEIEHVAGSL